MTDNKCIYLKIRLFSNKENIKEGLFDYGTCYREDKENNKITIIKNEFKDEKGSFYFLNSFNKNFNFIEAKESHCIKESEDNINVREILFQTRKSFINNTFEIISPFYNNMEKNEENIQTLNSNLWYVIKSDPIFCDNDNEDYILNENDIIKFGNKKYEIIKKYIKNNKIENQQNSNVSIFNEKKGSIFNIPKESEEMLLDSQEKDKDKILETSTLNESNKCRKCKNSNFSEDNPLLKLCSCEDFVHYECVKSILDKKKNDNKYDKYVKVYKYSNFFCDKCKKKYPIRIQYNYGQKKGKILMLINVKSDTDYIVLEPLDEITNTNTNKTIYIIELKDNVEINIGREPSKNQFIIKDQNISREHAVIKYSQENGKLILVNKSKTYGTSVLIKNNLKVKEKPIYIQVKNCYIMAKIINKEDIKEK